MSMDKHSIYHVDKLDKCFNSDACLYCLKRVFSEYINVDDILKIISEFSINSEKYNIKNEINKQIQNIYYIEECDFCYNWDNCSYSGFIDDNRAYCKECYWHYG